MALIENTKMAFSALLAHKLRSSLTMVGIAVGNASVIAMVAIGEGAQKMTAKQFESLGPKVLYVSLTAPKIRRVLSETTKPLVLADAEAIATQVPTVAGVAPEIHSKQLLTYRQQSIDSQIVGTTASYLNVRNFKMARGRFLSAVDFKRNHRVAVLGAEIAERLFGKQNPVGKSIRIKQTSFQVVGVLAPKGMLFGTNQDDKAIVPLTTMAYQLLGRTSPYGIPLSVIAISARDKNSISAAQFQVTNLLRVRDKNRQEDAVNIYPQKALMETAQKTDRGLTMMLAAIAAISLFVGGIGVMNIMLVSVTERTQEIGLRKAIGAKERDILFQFLLEAVILGTTGGVIGVLLGVGGVTITSAVSSLYTSLSPIAIIAAVGTSGTVGLFFGVLPAKRAAKLDPIAALRNS
ncbi:ABC transporter permease [Hydrococcus rivularis NIES-593]|uniref:ABC transporter permease n=1 Tax=Hydrococcus rivularis NIES-593 TaxID=1921803 RepID=A0A1U7HG06_9CYAN|nr:ABC transporter permease [Hydrococcus rivularis]OKH22532.1 ABC transporter permease [Hydrococcus rivularis NIES-593]